MKHKQNFVKKTTKLTLGEITGHSHQILEPVLVKENEQGLAVELVLEKPVELVHEEHGTIMLPVGNARVLVQREFDLLGEVRQVMD